MVDHTEWRPRGTPGLWVGDQRLKDQGQRPRARILIEASTDSEWVARCLEGLGHEVIVADPNFAPMYATRTRKIKTDRRDARALTDANLLGAYRPAHRLSDAQRHVRARLRVREALIRTRTRYISVIRALLRQHGYRVPSGSAEGFVRRVAAMALPGQLRSVIAPRLAVMLPVTRQLAYSDQAIEHLAAHDPRVQRLRTVPSIGPVTAAAFLATIDDPQRFHHAHEVAAYLGLVPREFSSGDTQRRGPITKAGPGRTRSLLIQAAVSMLRRRPPAAHALHTWALRIAVVALARRLAGILYALLRDGRVFQPRRAGEVPGIIEAIPGDNHPPSVPPSSGACSRA